MGNIMPMAGIGLTICICYFYWDDCHSHLKQVGRTDIYASIEGAAFNKSGERLVDSMGRPLFIDDRQNLVYEDGKSIMPPTLRAWSNKMRAINRR